MFCDFLSTTEDRFRIVKLSLRKLGHDDLVDALELKGRPARGAMKKSVASADGTPLTTQLPLDVKRTGALL